MELKIGDTDRQTDSTAIQIEVMHSTAWHNCIFISMPCLVEPLNETNSVKSDQRPHSGHHSNW